MKTDVLSAHHPVAYTHAIDVLTHGGLVAFPTDTIYGLATMLTDADVVDRLYIAKGRSTERVIAILIGKVSDMYQFVEGVTDKTERLIERFWPGPLTIIMKSRATLPENLAPAGQVGVRMPNHPVALRLLREAGPLAVTSASLTGRPFASTAQEVLDQLKGRIHLVLDGGPTPGYIPSTIVDFTNKQAEVLREGPISRQEIKEILQTE